MAKNSVVGASATTNKAWAIFGGVGIIATGGGSFEYQAFFSVRFWHELFSAPTDFVEEWNQANDAAGFALIQTQAPGSNGAAVLSGGTLVIEKDQAAGVMRFITPLGTMTALLSDPANPAPGNIDFDEANALGIYFLGHGHETIRPSLSTTTFSTEVDFHDAIDRKNGSITKQIIMSTIDPGSWFGTEVRGVYPHVEFAGYTGSNPFVMNNADLQLASSYRMKITWQLSDDPSPPGVHRSTFTARWRLLSAGGTGQNYRDMAHAIEHGPLWAAYVLPADISKIKLRTTYDNFHSSVVTDAYDNAMSANECPNINWFKDRLWLTWYDGTVIKQSFSQDWGVSWSTPVDLTLSGTNPRHLVDPDSGTSYYFFIDSMQSLVMKRSGDFGKTFWDGAAITVKTNVGLQTPAAQFTSSGELVVGWIDAISGDWTQLKSQDRGVTWI